jgi:HPt (histidine-containing phosphotransfer) domain-containing protein
MVSTQHRFYSEATQAGNSSIRSPQNCVAALDVAVIAALNSRDRSITIKAVDNFVADTPGHLKSLNKRMGSSDRAFFIKKCHDLQGSSARVGALAMATMCGDLANFADGDDIPSASRTLKLLETEFGCVRRALASAFDC